MEQTVSAVNSAAKKKSAVREYAEAIFVALLLAFFIREFLVQAFKIPSGSMKETLLVGDHILVSKFSYGVHIPNQVPFTSLQLFPDIHFFQRIPERGDIIVFKYPKDETRDFIKRVVGLSGETIEVRDQVIFINGKELIEGPHVNHQDPNLLSGLYSPRDNFPPTKIPEGHLFVMGDNRENSQDSRWWGVLDINLIKGRAFILYWSWDGQNTRLRWERLGKWLK